MLYKFKTESEWLVARMSNINSTDLAALFGLSARKSRRRLWHEKNGDVESDFEESNPSKWGKRLQDAVAAGICEDEGWTGEGMMGVYAVDVERRIGSSFDEKVICPNRGLGLMEVKTTESFSEEMGWFKERGPVEYEFQIQGELHSGNKEGMEVTWGCLAVLGGRSASRIYYRQYDEALGRLIDEEAEKFWESIATNKPPAPDYAVDGELLASMRKPQRLGDTINLSLNNRACELVGQYDIFDVQANGFKDQLAIVEHEKKKIKEELWDIMGRNERAVIGNVEIGARIQTNEGKFIDEFSFRRFDLKARKRKK